MHAQTTNLWLTNAGSGSWTNGADWSGGTAPSSGYLLQFSNSSTTTLTNDFTAGTSFAGLDFTTGASAYTIGGAAITLTGGITNSGTAAQTINLAIVNNTAGLGILTTAGGGNITLGGNISGTGGFTTAGTGGTLVLSGSNSYYGTTTVGTNATLQLQANAGNTTGAVSSALSGGSLLALNSGSTLSLLSDSNVTFTNNGLSLTNGTFNFSVNQLTSAGSNNTLTLAGGLTFANNSSSTINVTGGSGDTLALGSLSTQTLASGYSSTISASNAKVSVAAVNFSYYGLTLNLQGNTNITISSLNFISNGTESVVVGTGSDAPIVTLSGTNAASSRIAGAFGVTLNNGATLNVNNAGVFANPGSATPTTLTINGGTLNNTSGGALTETNNPTQTWNNDFAFAGSNNLNLGTGAVSLGTNAVSTRTVTVSAGNLTEGGVIANGTGSTVTTNLTLAGGGTLTLTGVNTYTGATAINAGSTLQLGGSGDLGAGNYAGAIANNGTLVDVSPANQTLRGNISGTGALTYNAGYGTLALAGSNSYSGTTTLTNYGTLQLQANAGNTTGGVSYAMSGSSALSLYSGTLSLLSDSNVTFANNGISVGYGTYNFSVNQLTSAGTNNTLTLAGGITLPVNDSITINVAGGAGDTLGLGTLTLTSSYSTPTATINATNASVVVAGVSFGAYGATLQLQGNTNITLSSLIFNSNGSDSLVVGTGSDAPIVTLSGANVSTNSRGSGTFGVTLNSGATLNVNNAGVFANPGGTGSGSLTINGGTLNNTSGGALTETNNPIQTWNNDFAFAGSNNLNLGTGAVSLGTNAGGTRTVTVSAGDLTVGGVIANGSAGTTNLTLAGAGTLTLTGANTYTGGTIVNVGTLLVNNTSGSGVGTGAVSVNGTLGGTGSIGGATTINSGGNLTPGVNGTGALTLNNSLTLASGSTTTFTINSGNYSSIILGSNPLTYGGAIVFNIAALSGAQTDTFFSMTGTETGNASGVSLAGTWSGAFSLTAANNWTLTNGGYSFDYNQANGQLVILAVPEPATYVLFGFGALVLIVAYRRKRVA